jgi:hypothetical protein
MAREWSVRLVGENGMEIRRDYSEDEQGFVNIEGDVLVNTEGQVLGQFSTVTDVGELTLSKNEPPRRTVIGAYQPDLPLLPDGTKAGWLAPSACPCPTCRKLIREGTTMERDQVARIAADIGSSLMPDNSQWMNRFTIESTSSSRTYTVAQRRSDGVWGCSCPAWINRRHCKHLVDILERLAKLTEFDVTDPAVLDMLRSARTTYLDLDSEYRIPSRFRTAQPTTRHIDL